MINLSDFKKDIEFLKKEILNIKQSILPQKVWWNLKDACEIKGVCYQTVMNKRKFQPNGGIPDAKVCGRKVWKNETIMKWLNVVDSDLEKEEKVSKS